MASRIYKLNEGDLEIFEKAKTIPDYFTEFYFKGQYTGTYWRPVEQKSNIPEINQIIDRWITGYDLLKDFWFRNNKPEFFDFKERSYQTLFDVSLNEPTFFDHHGLVILPWWRDVWDAKQTTRVILGGYGSAKTWFEMVRNLKKMATTPYYRCVVVAPYAIQATEVLSQAKRLLYGTEYYKRFMDDHSVISRPNPRITVRNDLCVESTMEFFSIERNVDKLLNISADTFHVEQAEQLDNIDWLFEVLGSRQRGQVAGRELEGIITLIANSSEEGNPTLWDLIEEATDDKGNDISSDTIARQPWIYDNPYITPRQLVDIATRIVRGGVQNLDRALKGARPKGSGEHFPLASIEASHNTQLDDLMNAQFDESGNIKEGSEAKFVTMPKAQVVEWSLPPEKDHNYLEVADPGWANPPARNSAAIMVFDVTNFPVIPAQLRAFKWVYGNNSPEPWISTYLDYCIKYKCINMNAFDSTGPQAGYGQMVHGLRDLNPWEVNTGGGKKFIYLNAAKTLTAKGLIQFPNIPLLFSQMAKYKLPDEKLRQDLVMTLMIAAAYLNILFYGQPGDETQEKPNHDGRYPFRDRGSTHKR